MHLPAKTKQKHREADIFARLIILTRIILAIYRQIKDTGFLPSNGARNAC
jgi:hypothetical protein